MTVYPFCRSVTIYWWRAELAQVGTHVWLAVGRDTTLLWDSAYSAVFLPGIEPRSARQQVKRRLLLTESPHHGLGSWICCCKLSTKTRVVVFVIFCINVYQWFRRQKDSIKPHATRRAGEGWGGPCSNNYHHLRFVRYLYDIYTIL